MSYEFPDLPGQLGLATTQQLLAAGASESALRHLTRTGRRVARNLYSAVPGPLPIASRLTAGALWAGGHAILTATPALALHGPAINRSPTLLSFLVPATCRPRRSPLGFVTVPTKRMPSAQVRAGVPIAPIERALVDAGLFRELPDRDLTAITLAVLQERRTTSDRLAHELARTRLASSGAILDGILAFRRGAWSWPESVLVDAVRSDRRLPAMVANRGLATSDGTAIGTPDGYFPDAGVVVQVHSRRFHDGTDTEGRDRLATTFEKDLTYQQHGLTVVPVSPRTLADDLPGFLTALAEVVAQRMGQAPAGVVVL